MAKLLLDNGLDPLRIQAKELGTLSSPMLYAKFVMTRNKMVQYNVALTGIKITMLTK